MSQVVTRQFYHDYNPASETDFVYGKLADGFRSLPKAVKTSGSSTTVSENTTGDGSFGPLGVGDILYNPANGNTVIVTAKASDAEITVSSTVNWAAGTNIHFRKFMSGQTVDDGWIGCGDLSDKTVRITIDSVASASITATIESRMPNMPPATLLTPANFTAVSVSSTTGVSSFADIAIPETAQAVRVGLKVGTDGTDVVNAALMGRRAD
jgi:hypothetical protein